MKYCGVVKQWVAVGVIILSSSWLGYGKCINSGSPCFPGPAGVCPICPPGSCTCSEDDCSCPGGSCACTAPGSCLCGGGEDDCKCIAEDDCICPVVIDANGAWVLPVGCTPVRTLNAGDAVLFTTPTVTPVGLTLVPAGSGSGILFSQAGIYQVNVGLVTQPGNGLFILSGVTITGNQFVVSSDIVLAENAVLIDAAVGNTLLILLNQGTAVQMCNGTYPGDQAVIMVHLVNPNP